ncbi:hypothetical protein MAP00_008853 [Monascus purpureus]|nr:hypothetical protein MAP00_008853 [Monascus purpureus]
MAAIQQWTVTEPYIDTKGTLLEGPYHDEKRNEFRFVDIWDHKVYFMDLAKGPDSLRSIETATSVGVTADVVADGSSNANANTYSDQMIVGAKHGFALLDRRTGALSYLRKVWDGEEDSAVRADLMRSNDGAVDSHGRFWVGAMNDPKVKKPIQEGVLFRLDPDLKLHRMLEQLTIPNGIGWNDRDDTMYVTDSPTGRIYAFDFDASTGAISNQRVHFQLSEPKEPDGFAIDTDGCIWSAIYGGRRVIRISPEGKVIGEVLLPTRNVTCCAFVGTELFITTAKDEPNDELPKSELYGGKVFRVDVGIKGQPKNQFRFQK